MAQLSFQCKSYFPDEFTGGTVFLISAFKTKGWYYGPIINTLLDKGFKVYVYDYLSRPLLDAYPKEWVEFSERITGDIADKIAAEKSNYPNARFGIIGVSVGSVLAMHAAKICSELEKIMFVTLYGSSAQHVWEHPVLVKVRHKFESSNLGIKEAYEVFGHLEPTYRLDLIGSRKIMLFANEKDPVIRYSNTKLFIDAAEKHGIDLIVRLVKSRRHSTTILRVFSDPSQWVPFFMGLKYRKKDDTHIHEVMAG